VYMYLCRCMYVHVCAYVCICGCVYVYMYFVCVCIIISRQFMTAVVQWICAPSNAWYYCSKWCGTVEHCFQYLNLSL